jgi:hypothetical protein
MNEQQLAIWREFVDSLTALCSETALHLADAGCSVVEAVNATAVTMVRFSALTACRNRIIGFGGVPRLDMWMQNAKEAFDLAVQLVLRQKEVEARDKAWAAAAEPDDAPDMTTCEGCEKRFPLADAVSTNDDCNLCPACDALWREMFVTCAHRWQEQPDRWGESARVCTTCSGIVTEEDATEMFQLICDGWVEVGTDA